MKKIALSVFLLTSIIVLTVSLISSPSYADILWNQPEGSTYTRSFGSGVIDAANYFLIADDFSINSNSDISNITLYSRIYNSNTISVNIYQDDSGKPFTNASSSSYPFDVSPLWSWSGNLTGNSSGSNIDISINPIGLQLATGKYWIMAYQSDGFGQFSWDLSDTHQLNDAMYYRNGYIGGIGPNNSWASLTDYSSVISSSLPPQNIDLAFKIEGTSAPVPEPSTMLLLGSGLVGLVGYGRRRFKK